MIVDYVRFTNSSISPKGDPQPVRIRIPPFHTGSTGLVPDTEWHISLTEGHLGPDVLIRPYQSNQGNLMRLTCTMQDQPGVVGRLVDAIAKLEINILVEVSSGIDLMKDHTVSLLLDWSTSREYSRITPSTPGAQRHYADFHAIFPVGIDRCVKLFESICEHCGDMIVTQNSDGKEVPMLTMSEVSTPANLLPYGAVTVEKCAVEDQDRLKTAYHVEIALPKPLETKLRLILGVPEPEPLPYILNSEEESRTSRAFFLRPERIPQVLHLAFYHIDKPGAFGAILHPLADAGFNILTSLVRQNNNGRNVLEAVLDYTGTSPVPQKPANHKQWKEHWTKLCTWAADRLAEQVTSGDAKLLKQCDLRVGLPRYPARIGQPEPVPIISRLKESGLRESRPRAEVQDCWLVKLARDGTKMSKPSIYLSHTAEGYLHAKAARKKLADHFQVSELTSDDSLPLDEVVRRIGRFDYFVGIWLANAGNDTGAAGVSPRNMADLAAALALGKKVIILHAAGLNIRVLKQLGPAARAIEFSTPTFENESIEDLERSCREYFRQSIFVGRGTSEERQGPQESPSLAKGDSGPEDPTQTKVDFARTLIRQAASNGVSVGELYEQFEMAGVEVARTYLYSMIQRLADQKKIKQIGRRYFALEADKSD